MLLGVGVQDGALFLSVGRKRHGVGALWGVEHPCNEAVLAFPDRSRCAFTAHGAVDGLDAHLARECRRVGLPRGNQALAGLTGSGGGVQSLADCLVDGLDRQVEHGADTRCNGWAEVGHVVNLPLVEADGLNEVDLDFVAGRDAAQEGLAIEALVLCHGNHRRDIVAWVRVLGCEEGVVVVELAYRGAVGQRSPLSGVVALDAENLGALAGACGVGRVWVALCDDACGGHWAAGHGSHCDGGVVDDAVDDHLLGLLRYLNWVGGDLGDLVGQVLFDREILGGLVSADFVVDHRCSFGTFQREVP